MANEYFKSLNPTDYHINPPEYYSSPEYLTSDFHMDYLNDQVRYTANKVHKEENTRSLLRFKSGKPKCCVKNGVSAETLQAYNTAKQALGEAVELKSALELAELAKDTSSSGQSKYLAALTYNEEAKAQNDERNEIISLYIKNSFDGEINPDDVRFGNAVLTSYSKFKNTYGDKVKALTIEDLVIQYPSEIAYYSAYIVNQTPELNGMNLSQLIERIPQNLKNMSLEDLSFLIPSSSWIDLTENNSEKNNLTNCFYSFLSLVVYFFLVEGEANGML